MKTIQLDIDPNDSWAEVELWRWQYGELPRPDDMRPLDVAAGLRGMADAIERGCQEKNTGVMPAPFNVCSVLRYIAGKAPSDPSGTDSSGATSVLLKEALKHPGVKEVEEVYKKYQQPESSPSAAAVNEEEKWTVIQSQGFKNRCHVINHARQVMGANLWPDTADQISCAHNASLERHAKRVKQELRK